MHIVLTDLLTCPRCGPEFGLILLADRTQDRRVLEGSLGCSNCRERYPIRAGFAELAAPGSDRGGAPAPGSGSKEEALRLAALLALNEATGFCAVVGRDARLGGALSALAPDVEVVVIDACARDWSETTGVSRMVASGTLPFFARSLRGLAVTRGAQVGLEDAARVVAPASRLVYEGAGADAAVRLGVLGMQLLAQDDDVVVAVRKLA